MYPLDYEEETFTHDLAVDDASSMLRATADLFEESARATSDVTKREMLLDYAKLYRSMADLSDEREREDEDDDGPERPSQKVSDATEKRPQGAAQTMFKDSDAMRVKADDYRQMAEEATDPDERRKFLSYATVYDELAKRRKQEEEQFEGALPHGRRDRPD